ncbi:unnamed protein product [Closterium sp. Naga37s-1]|nr:unnamed protein product [Closterium sp. Naga37s-1]
MYREPAGPDDSNVQHLNDSKAASPVGKADAYDNSSSHSRSRGRVLTPEEHWQRYRPQLATRYGHWRFWLPAQGREAKLSLELLREITPVEVESGAEEYVLRPPSHATRTATPQHSPCPLPTLHHSPPPHPHDSAFLQNGACAHGRYARMLLGACNGPGAQLNVAFSEASLSLRQDDTVLSTDRHNNSHTGGSGASYKATDRNTSPSGQSLHDTWASPHWKTPLPTHLPASLPPLPPKPLYGVPHYIYTDLYATPLPEHLNNGLETQNMEVFSGYLAGVPKAQHSRYGVWALPRGVVVAMPSPLEPLLSREGEGKGEEFWLVVTYVKGGGQGVQGGGDGELGGVEVGGDEGEEEVGGALADTGYMAEGEWKVQQVVIAYDAQGRFEYVKHTRFM